MARIVLRAESASGGSVGVCECIPRTAGSPRTYRVVLRPEEVLGEGRAVSLSEDLVHREGQHVLAPNELQLEGCVGRLAEYAQVLLLGRLLGAVLREGEGSNYLLLPPVLLGVVPLGSSSLPSCRLGSNPRYPGLAGENAAASSNATATANFHRLDSFVSAFVARPPLDRLLVSCRSTAAFRCSRAKFYPEILPK